MRLVLMKREGTADFMTIKYDAEFRERTCKHIKESGKLATSITPFKSCRAISASSAPGRASIICARSGTS
jgi:hypothetical protein